MSEKVANSTPPQPKEGRQVPTGEINNTDVQLFASIALQSSEHTHNQHLLSNQNLYETDKDNESSQNYDDRAQNPLGRPSASMMQIQEESDQNQHDSNNQNRNSSAV